MNIEKYDVFVKGKKFQIANFAQKSGFSIDKWVMEAVSSQKELKKRKLGVLLKKAKKTM